MICKKCNIDKVRTFSRLDKCSKKFPSGRPVYVDEKGVRWDHLVCGPCRFRARNKKIVRATKRKKGAYQQALRYSCVECFKESEKFLVRSHERYYYYLNENSKRLTGNRCYPCSLAYKTRRNRLLGHKSMDDVEYPSHKKGRDAEKRVAEFLRSKKFDVVLNKKHGTDLLAARENHIYKVEVKSIYQRKGHSSWTIDRMKETAQKSDILAIVHKNKIYFEPMAVHLLNHGFSNRTVTKLFFKKPAGSQV